MKFHLVTFLLLVAIPALLILEIQMASRSPLFLNWSDSASSSATQGIFKKSTNSQVASSSDVAPDIQVATAEESTNIRPFQKDRLTKILNPRESFEKRSQLLYQLIQVGNTGISELGMIAASALPADCAVPGPAHSLQNSRYTGELAMRITALEALDRQAEKDPIVQQQLLKVLQYQKQPSLVFLASISLRGLQQGRPGKLRRYIDQLVDGKFEL